MPAYRSSAEGEIRQAVIAELRLMLPGCRIINEVNAASFGNRIDVLAVGESELIAVEIKSAKDKLERLPDQIKAMRSVSNHVFAALHEKFLRPLGKPEHGYGLTAPDEASGAIVWVYPRIERKGHAECGETWLRFNRWDKPRKCLPHGALGMLWAEELRAVCAGLGLRATSKMTMPEAADLIQWHMTGEQITRAICSTLRTRQCVEADPAIEAIEAAA